MLNPTYQALIIGAGPTGLALANLFASHGISFRIIDKNPARSTQSKALGIQAGTLEAIDHHLGHNLTKDLIKAGNPLQEVIFHFYNQGSVSIDLSVIPSLYNFILILPQDQTEKILEERLNYLGVKVERDTELLSFTQQENFVTAVIRNPQGEEKIQTSFVVGCDGAHSIVRHLLNLNFAGGAYSGNFILGDVEAKFFNQKNSLQIFLSNKGGLAYFPTKDQQLGRLILIPKNANASTTDPINLEEFSKLVDELVPNPITINKAPWLTRFGIHHRIASRFQHGRVFLAGDAAHIHSPAGGQGMNTGIQDAFNLGFKLVQVLNGKADFNLLAEYEKERYPIAKKILKSTDIASRYVIFNNGFLATCFKKYLLPKILSWKWVQKKLAIAISEIGVARKEINCCKLH